MSPYTNVLCKFTCVLVKSRQRQLGKTVVIKAWAYIVSMDSKTTVYGLEADKIVVFEKRVQAVHIPVLHWPACEFELLSSS